MLRLRLIRYAGFLAACLLALAGWLGGARPDGDVTATPADVASGPHGVVVIGGWLLGTAGLAAAWWAARDAVPSVRWAVVTIVLWLLPFGFVPPTGSRDVYSYACQGHLFLSGVNPYEAGVATVPCPWLDAVPLIWRDTPAPYGPLFVVLAAAAVSVGGSLTAAIVLFRTMAVAGLVAVAVCLPVLARRCGVPAPRALWIALAGPLVGVHLVGGAHNDALLLGLVVAGLAVLVGARRRPGWEIAAGVLFGLAVAVKAPAAVVLPFAVLIAVPRPLRPRPAAAAVLRVAGVAAGVLAAVTAASGLGAGWVTGIGVTQDLVQFTSLPTAVGMTLTYAAQGVGLGLDAVPAVRFGALVLMAVVLTVLWWRSAAATGDPVRAALRGAALACVTMVALAPSFHPWYAMMPLILLAATTLRTDLMAAVAVAAAMLVLPDGSGLARFAKFPGAPLVTLLIVVWLVRRLRAARTGDAGPAPLPAGDAGRPG